jgi:hypothetical protein
MMRGVSAGILVLALISCRSVAVTPTPTATSTASASATAIASATASSSPSSSPILARKISEADAEREVGTAVRDVLSALKSRDSTAIAGAAHPTKGVRFTAYAYVQPAVDVTLTAAQLTNAFADPTKRRWGTTDGKGDPIVLTFAEYHGQYIYTRDFATSSRTAYNRTIGGGNSPDNTSDVYPNAILFEAFDPGPDPQLTDVQWQCLRLLFEREQGRWYLVAVVHGQWTI